jgi:phage I-like protein
MATFGYWVDLQGHQFDDAEAGSWIQAMPLGTYQHPVHGTIDITPERVAQFAANVNSQARGTELDIDYDHKAQRQDAAGWVKQADARPDGLYLFVQWTNEAISKIKEKAYRYFSPEFVDEWVHPKSGQKFKDVLFGGALTNRPFLKDIAPVNMSEVIAGAEAPKQKEGTGMTPEQIAQLAVLLGLDPKTATAEQVLGAAAVHPGLKANIGVTSNPPEAGNQQQQAPPAGQAGQPQANGQTAQQNGAQGAQQAQAQQGQQQQATAASELPSELVKLAETNPALATFLADQQKQLAVTTAALKLSETTNWVAALNEKAKAKGFAFPPVFLDELQTALLDMPVKLSESKLAGALVKLSEVGMVQLGEIGGHTDSSRSGNVDAVKQFEDAVDKVVREDKLDYLDATNRVASMNPKLFAEYREASTSFHV